MKSAAICFAAVLTAAATVAFAQSAPVASSRTVPAQVQNSTDAELIRHFYKALEKITVLDPTCGSGAFLFAAMNILEPLYEACIGRMHAFVDEGGTSKYKVFNDVLKRVDAPEHPNLQYFIFKSIILNNLFGVDIMKEAIEIAKLRLFLKLVACVDVELKKPNMGLEPLPDIDFNIRSGSTLVGFVTIDDVKKAVPALQAMFLEKVIKEIEDAAEYVKRAYDSFREVQIVGDATVKEFKKILTEKLANLNEKLDGYLAGIYGKDPKKAVEYKAWHDSHKPFHWFSEFYEIVHDRGGFDVIIGNPPYVEYSKIKNYYSIKGYSTESCGNLYAYVMELCFCILKQDARMGFIVQLPIVCTDRMKPLQSKYLNNSRHIWFSTFDDRPARLFDGLEHIRATIAINIKSDRTNTVQHIFSTNYMRWYSDNRPILFDSVQYCDVANNLFDGAIPKIGDATGIAIRNKINKLSILSKRLVKRSKHQVYFHNAPQYWIRAMNFAPYFWNERNGEQISTQVKSLYFNDNIDSLVATAILNSSIYYWWFITLSDCRHLNMREIDYFPIGMDKISIEIKKYLSELSVNLMKNMKDNSYRKECYYKTTGKVVYDEYYPKYSKEIIDKIDTVLATHYGFTENELYYIINYDLKYRMGKGVGDDEDAE